MSMSLLGDHFDIHTGGVDHQEVHHPNEDAQSRGYLEDGQAWVRYWLHNEWARFGGEKMAKSKGNVLTLDDVDAIPAHPLAYRVLLLASHYRSPIDVTIDLIAAADRRLTRVVDVVAARLGAEELAAATTEPLLTTYDRVTADATPAANSVIDDIDAAMSNDLATPKAFTTFEGAIRSAADADLKPLLAAGQMLFGLDLRALANERERAATDGVDDGTRQRIEALIAARAEARSARDFARADAIRVELHDEFGVILTDHAGGTDWKIGSA
jgi:cysteinyl-tRNA synthetase